ncbi:cytochrome P450 [Bradyrhizobium sp. 2TAF24]|uniref:cytochrome P450 n=1 Tax=Bradyrhizobium sp. 2TAF24 TaxID=3233011 RepID=UPI003F92B38C
MPVFKYFDTINARLTQNRTGQPQIPDFDIDAYASSSLASRTASWLFAKAVLIAFAIFRALWPNPKFGRLVVVTRDADVRQVLGDSTTFEVPFGPEMTQLAGVNLVLGMDGPEQQQQHAILASVVRRGDVDAIRSQTAALSQRLLAASGGRIDIMKDLITRVAAEVGADYLGIEVDDYDSFAGYTIAISLLLFADPFGNEDTYQRALRAAFDVRRTIDRSIARTKTRMVTGDPPPADNLMTRLLALQGSNPQVTDDMIRSNLMGLATGLIPTLTLAAGKAFDVLLGEPNALAGAIAAAKTGDKTKLGEYLLEAARLSPALSPGQWRYAKHDGVIAPGTWRARRVPAGSILMVATSSALRDRRRFAAPNRFELGRANEPDLIFGVGPHWCLGKYVALTQMQEIFGALFQQKDLRRSTDAAGRPVSVGPFPRRLDVEFAPTASPRSQTMLVVCAPVPAARAPQAQALIDTLGNPASDDVARTLTAAGIVHFTSLSMVNVGSDAAPVHTLVLELNLDGDRASALPRYATAAQPWLGPIFALADGAEQLSLAEALDRFAIPFETRPWGATGLNFNGTPEFAVDDIARQTELAAFARDALQHYQDNHLGLGSRAMVALDYVRGFIRQNPRFVAYANTPSVPEAERARVRDLLARGKGFADFMIRPSRRTLAISDWTGRTGRQALAAFLTCGALNPVYWTLAGLFVASALIVYLSLGASWSPALLGRLTVAAGAALTVTLVLAGAVVAGFLALLRWHEDHDLPDDREAVFAHIQEVSAPENASGYVQNHFTAVTPLKPGWFRKLTLALSLWGIKQLVVNAYRPGFVLDMGTIHYARWFRLPGTEKLIFLSNFDGSWESYLEDFVMKAHAGQSAAWSNGVGFPRTRFLIYGGAEDGDRFKRWVRRQQVRSQFWYSRFPRLTTDQIRDNAVIHDGLMRARTETAARAWLDCFASLPRPDYAIETDEVQSLVFRGLGELPFMGCALVRLPDDAATCRGWLKTVMPDIGFSTADQQSRTPAALAFGDKRFSAAATFVGFSASGLAKLGLSAAVADEGLASFPSVFNFGMARRSRVLGDAAASGPDHWLWADQPRPEGDGAREAADAVLLVYGQSPDECAQLLAQHATHLGGRERAFLHVVETSPVAPDKPSYNHFGFREGISQPVIKGTQRFNLGALPRDTVEPGEFILGYRNNQNYFPPTPTVDPESDHVDALPNVPASAYARYPAFATKPPYTRDFGRNGSFLAIRQFALDADGFEAFTQRKADELRTRTGLSTIDGAPVTADWVAAKLMGRQRNGVPLIAGSTSPDDNDFSYGADDPQGLTCPFGAHMRRANPRDSLEPLDPTQQQITNRHRLMRRGRSYTTTDATGREEKGLLFIGVCADIERQFEFIQQSWISSPVFHGLTDEPDPITATAVPGEPRVFTIPTHAGPVALGDMQSFTTVRGGGYFFLPSRSAMRYLVNLRDAAQPPAAAAPAAEQAPVSVVAEMEAPVPAK